MAAFRHPAGLKVELWAADPLLASPVAICLDEKNRVFVAEEYRFNQGTEENRTRPFLLEDDLQIRTTDERLAMYRKWAHKFPGGMDWFSKHADQVRLLEDRKGRGFADFSSVFAGGFNDPLDGLGSGLIARDGEVYFTCIPNLWRLRDTKGTGHADKREVLHRGFGVNCAFLGHDLHGLVWGPDGRLYFSVGDRGFHVTTREGVTHNGPRTGAVFRCEPDGSQLEVVCRGLRNPQELAFDQFGNLFADDNNCDKGDHARLVYCVEGGDSGWNMAYQTIPDPYLTGPWHAERMWHLPHVGQPAWIVPPVGKIGAGPSGFVFTSGLSLPERYRNKFFYCNYTGNGGIESFGVMPKGAGFEIVDHHDFLKPIMATDCDFGYDGKMYVSDFVNLLWDGGTAGGRIYTVFDQARINDPIVLETKSLFADGFKQRNSDELVKLLAHADMRVRQRAQFTLADRNEMRRFIDAATIGQDRFARLHAIWGLGQIGRKQTNERIGDVLTKLLHDTDDEIRTQAARTIGELRVVAAAPTLIQTLADASARVRFQAALALGKLCDRSAVGPIFELVRTNNDQDPFLRHAAVMALTWINDRDEVLKRCTESSPAVRLAVVLVMRRWQDARLARFLVDDSIFVATEAARAIHDLPIADCLPALAKRLAARDFGGADADSLLRRAISAAYGKGTLDDAKAVLAIAANPRVSAPVRHEAISAIGDWAGPATRDRVTGFWRPMQKRDATAVQQMLAKELPGLLASNQGKLQTEVIHVVSKLGVSVDEGVLRGWLEDPKRSTEIRNAAFQLVAARKPADLEAIARRMLYDADARIRAEARTVLAMVNPSSALTEFEKVLNDEAAPAIERQSAMMQLARIPNANKLLDRWVERLQAGTVPNELLLELTELLRGDMDANRKQAAAQWDAKHPTNDFQTKLLLSARGGDSERGRAIFVGHTVAQCIRCHRIRGEGGDAGPDLTDVVKRNPEKTREHLLESMLLPNAKIAAGFGSIAVTLNNGKTVTGLLKSETSERLLILTPDNREVIVPVSQIDERTSSQSAMPSVDRALTLRELRDLVEYLASLK